MLVVGERIRIPLREIQFSFARSSGPGGQNVNKTSSKAVLRWQVARSPSLPKDVRARFLERYAHRITALGELVLQSQRFRDQPRNIADCLEKLHALLESVARPPRRRRPTQPGRGAIARRLDSKQHQSQRKRQRRKPLRGDE